MARCSAVWPNIPSAFITSASVFQSLVFNSSLKSWSTVVGLVPSNRTRTLSFFFMSYSQSAVIRTGAKRSRGVPQEHLEVFQRDASISLDHDELLRPLEFAGEKIIHHQCRDKSGDTKILLRI